MKENLEIPTCKKCNAKQIKIIRPAYESCIYCFGEIENVIYKRVSRKST